MKTEVSKAPNLVTKFASKYSIEPEKLLNILKATAFKAETEVSNEQLAALLIVADQHGLNPFTREIYAFEDKRKGIVPVVSVDGWARIINDHPDLDGIDFAYEHTDGVPVWVECHIYRKGRAHPTKVREWFSECKRGSQPWQSHPNRMLRHKAFIQCARLAFGFSGIYDEDEAARIAEAQVIEASPLLSPKGGVKAMEEKLQAKSAQDEPLPGEVVEVAYGGTQ